MKEKTKERGAKRERETIHTYKEREKTKCKRENYRLNRDRERDGPTRTEQGALGQRLKSWVAG